MKETAKEELVKKLKKIRKELGLNQKEMAMKLSITPTYVALMETTQSNKYPSNKLMKKILELEAVTEKYSKSDTTVTSTVNEPGYAWAIADSAEEIDLQILELQVRKGELFLQSKEYEKLPESEKLEKQRALYMLKLQIIDARQKIIQSHKNKK